MCWKVNPTPIKDVAYEMQYQKWVLTSARNSCTHGLKIKIATIFDTLPGHQQAGVVYVWLMLDIIVNITPDVQKGLKDQA